MKNAIDNKQALKQFKEELKQLFLQKRSILFLTNQLVNFIDLTLRSIFKRAKIPDDDLCLLALGSYGRRELQLYSDIDLLLLHSESISKKNLAKAQKFIQECWDIGLNISHQLTTVAACAELASEDLSVISSILDIRLLCGTSALMEELIYKTNPLNIWPSDAFFFAKKEEQRQRYIKYGETAYNLEPNVKQGPGGLRDLQILLSIGKRHYKIKKMAEGIACNFITDKEYEDFLYCQHFLWRVRFALHILASKQEERLLFNYQLDLAAMLGFADSGDSLGIELFMKSYFKVIKRSRELNDLLLQWFSEVIAHKEKQKIIPLDENFQLSNNFIEVKSRKIFLEKPRMLIVLFYWLAIKPSILGIRAGTIRLIRAHLFLMNRKFLHSPEVTKYFLGIFKDGQNPFIALQQMSRYGVLGHYLECFQAVTGQMQYDLFHVYTVEQHTLFVIRNLLRFLHPDFSHLFPLASSLMTELPKKHILYLAALFHDIAKGRGGDHSELGALEAKLFAERHSLKEDETALLQWLVSNHLLMSHTAQRKDIYDPKTVQEFCSLLPEPAYLNYLYLLTVADICATNPSLWNSWRDSLLKELYKSSKQQLQENQAYFDENFIAESRRKAALDILLQQKISADSIKELWQNFKQRYFSHESAELIAKHTLEILASPHYPLVLVLPHHSQAGIEVFIYMPHIDERFTITTTILANCNVTIQEAGISICDNNFDLDTYIILNENHQAFFEPSRLSYIQQELIKALKKASLPLLVKRRISRTLAHFKLKPRLSFDVDEASSYTRLLLIAKDRPGLLALVSNAFSEHNIVLHNAKISTTGERVEDAFYLSTQSGKPLEVATIEALKTTLLKFL